MNEIISMNSTEMMGSKEIAELTGKRHSDVLRDTRVMLDQMQNADLRSEEYQEVKAANGMTAEIRLNKRLSYVLVTGYSVPLRVKVIDRWQELEKGKVPGTLIEALRAYADVLEQKEAIEKEAEVLQITLDQSMDWASVKKMEKRHGRSFPWAPLKAHSQDNGYEIKRVFDANYGEVNAYHKEVWLVVYGVAP